MQFQPDFEIDVVPEVVLGVGIIIQINIQIAVVVDVLAVVMSRSMLWSCPRPTRQTFYISPSQYRYRAGDALQGLPSGFSNLDAIVNNWKGGHLVVIAARPNMDKTT